MGVEFSRTTVLSLLDECKETFPSDSLSRYRLDVLSKTIFKKFIGPQYDSRSLEDLAFGRFLEQNREVFHIPIDSSSRLIRYVKAELLAMFCEPFSLNDCVNKGYCGPGASRKVRDTDFFSKMFDSSLTSTSTLLQRTYTQAISPEWYLAETLRHQLHGSELVSGSKLCSVPKDESRRRVICTEPTLNMFFQLGAKEHLESCLRKSHNIDFSNQQEINRSLAREGSRSLRFVTLDLKDASDRISLQLCKTVLPPWLYNLLMAIRSPSTNVYSKDVELNMISTMGNGTTFPLMTSILSCVVRSVYQINGINPKNGVNYAVFGDDIICLTDLHQEVIDSVEALGFIINIDKSCLSGHFRESCGGDYLKGFDVRGVYIKGLNNESDFYSSFNRLLSWSCRFGIDITNVLLEFFSLCRFRPIPGDGQENSGHVWPSDITAFLDHNSNAAVKYSCVEPCPRRRRATVTYNEQGCIISFIGGYIRSGYITSRQHNVRYKVHKRITPNWCLVNDFSRGWFNNQEHVEFSYKVLTLYEIRRLEALLL